MRCGTDRVRRSVAVATRLENDLGRAGGGRPLGELIGRSHVQDQTRQEEQHDEREPARNNRATHWPMQTAAQSPLRCSAHHPSEASSAPADRIRPTVQAAAQGDRHSSSRRGGRYSRSVRPVSRSARRREPEPSNPRDPMHVLACDDQGGSGGFGPQRGGSVVGRRSFRRGSRRGVALVMGLTAVVGVGMAGSAAPARPAPRPTRRRHIPTGALEHGEHRPRWAQDRPSDLGDRLAASPTGPTAAAYPRPTSPDDPTSPTPAPPP